MLCAEPTGKTIIAEGPLAKRRILVAEDEYLLADELRAALGAVGALVLGPVGTLGDTLRLIDAESLIDGAVLDLNLRGEMVFPAADRLRERDIPFLFATGYDAVRIPSRFEDAARWEKPINTRGIALAVEQLFKAADGNR